MAGRGIFMLSTTESVAEWQWVVLSFFFFFCTGYTILSTGSTERKKKKLAQNLDKIIICFPNTLDHDTYQRVNKESAVRHRVCRVYYLCVWECVLVCAYLLFPIHLTNSSSFLWHTSNCKYVQQSTNKLLSHAFDPHVEHQPTICVLSLTERGWWNLYNCQLVNGVAKFYIHQKECKISVFFFTYFLFEFFFLLFIRLFRLSFCLTMPPLPPPLLSSLHYGWHIPSHRRIKCDIEYLFMGISEVYVCLCGMRYVQKHMITWIWWSSSIGDRIDKKRALCYRYQCQYISWIYKTVGLTL